MSHGEWIAQVQQREEQELERAGREEAEWRRQEDANLILQEMQAARDEEFVESLAEKFPMLRAWPGKEKK